MAILKGKHITGLMSGMVFKKWRELQVIQSRPGTGGVKQTQGSEKSAGLFGKASSLGKSIRLLFEELTGPWYDGTMINRLTKEIQTIIQPPYHARSGNYEFSADSFKRLAGFDFNLNSAVRDSLLIEPECTLSAGKLLIKLPEISIPEQLKFPATTSSCSIQFLLRSYNLENGYSANHAERHTIKVNRKQRLLEKQEFSFPLPPGCLCLTSIALHYYQTKYNTTVLFNHKNFNPTGICSALITTGAAEMNDEGGINNAKAIFGRFATTDQASLH